MEKPTSQLVEEAVLAIKQGEISLENGETRFGAAWPEIKGEVALILDLEAAGNSFKSSLPTPDLAKIWSQIVPALTLVDTLPVAPSEATPVRRPQPQAVNPMRLETKKPAKPFAPPDSLAETPKEPISLPDRNRSWGRWRKPLVWAAAIVLVAVLSFGSLVGVANAAEPGDFFYGTKLWLDNARAVVAFSPQDKQNFALSYCSHRQEELEWLVKNYRLQYFSDVASDYQATIQKAFTGSVVNVSNEQTNLLRTQQTRLSQLSGQLAAVNAAGASQASAQVDKLVQQLGAYQNPGQNNPVPTPTPGTTTPAALTPSVPASPVAVTPGVSATASVSATVMVGATVGVSTTAIPVASPPVTTTTIVAPTVEISDTQKALNTPAQIALSTPTSTPTPAAGNSGSNVALTQNATPNQVVSDSDEDADDQGNTGNNNGNSQGNGNGQNNEHHASPTAQPTRPTSNPAPPTPAPTATPRPAQTTAGTGNDNENGQGQGRGNGQFKAPKTIKISKPTKPIKPEKPGKTKKP